MTGAAASRPPSYRMVRGGEWVAAAGEASFESLNPYTGAAWATAPDGSAMDVTEAVGCARSALDGEWSRTTPRERAALMRRLADILARDAQELARIESTDNGKVIREMAGQTASLPDWLHYFAGLADKITGETLPSGKPNHLVYTREEPVGVVGAIVPWNSPLLMTIFKLAPALAAGCTMVLKPSDQTPISALELARRVEEAGFPAGVFNVVTGLGPVTGRALAGDPGVAKVAFTGSTRVGVEVGKAAIRNMARLSLELGGKSAQVVLEDADIEAAANGIVAGIFAAGGQTCLAGSRVIVHERLHDELVDRLVRRAREIRLGDPLDPVTEMGPLVSEQHLERVLGFVQRAVGEGATLLCGGGRPDGLDGFFVEPTILAAVEGGSEIAQEEIFGPVLAVMPIKDEEEAVRLANGTRYGLAASVWTSHVQRAHAVAHRLRAGTVYINSYRIVDPGVPFGGVKMSGIGRENGARAVREYTETKAVWLEMSAESRDPFKLG
jgi:acyl-CoA reductase-like NAD-dependent aldehyde dehydrogenase